MMEWIIAALAVALIGAVLVLAVRRRSDGHEGDYTRRARWARGAVSSTDNGGRTVKALQIENVGVGGVFRIQGFGPQMEDVDLHVKARHVYDEDGWIWAELECDSKFGTVFVTIEVDDEVGVSATLRKLTLNEAGLSAAALDRTWEDETGSVVFEDTVYRMAELGDAIFYPRGDEQRAVKFRYWEYTASGGQMILSVERWGRGEFDVHLSTRLSPHQITVYSLNGASS